MPAGADARPWWERLPEDFYQHADSTEIDHLSPLQIAGTAALDRLARSGLGTMISAGMGPRVLSRRFMRADLGRGDFYRELADRGCVEEVFPVPPAVRVQSRSPGRRSYRPPDIPVQELCFASPFVPLHPELRGSYAALGANAQAHAQYWSEPGRPRPTLIFLHGFSLSNYGINSRMFSLPWFYRKGYDILLVTMPFHGRRRERFDPFHGYGWFAHGWSHINEAMLQAVCDTRVWAAFLRELGAPAVGVSGLSLGGYITSLMAAVDENLAFAIPNSPVVAPTDMAREWWPSGPLLHLAMKLHNFSLADQRHMLALHSPLTYPSRLAAERLMIIGGAGDRFTSPRFVRLLHQHWQGSELLWFPGNHLLHLNQRDYLRQMLAFMNRAVQSPSGNPSEA